MDSDNYEDTDDELIAAAQAQQQQQEQQQTRATSPPSENARKPKKGEAEPAVADEPFRRLFTKEEYEAHLLKTQKEREKEIFERLEEEAEREAREKIQKDLDKKQRKAERRASKGVSRAVISSDDSSSDEEFQRGVQRKKPKKSASERNSQGKAALAFHDVFGAASTSDSSSSDDSSEEGSSHSSRASSTGRIDDSDGEEPKKKVESRQDLQMARITRIQLAKFVHAPFFGDVVRGSFVQIRVGRIKESVNDSIICQVLSVEQTGKVYDLEGTRTNKGVKIKYANHERIYRLNFVSNSDWKEDVYNEWLAVATDHKMVPTMEHVERKQKEIFSALNHTYNNKEIDLMVQEKKRFFKDKVRNTGALKAELLIKLKYAEEQKDREGIARIQKEIDELDKKSEASEPQHPDLHKKTWMQELILSRKHLKEPSMPNPLKESSPSLKYEHEGDDPFTRKREHTRVVCGSGKSISGTKIYEASKRKASEEDLLKKRLEVEKKERDNNALARQPFTLNRTFEMYKNLGRIEIDFDDLGSPSAKKGCFSPSSKPSVEKSSCDIVSEDESGDERQIEFKTEYESSMTGF